MIRRSLVCGLAAAACVLSGLAVPVSAQTSLGADSQRFSYKFSVDYFVQVSSRQNLAATDERFNENETFVWERLRPKVIFGNQHLNVVVEGQDTHSRGSEYAVRRAWLDLLNAYVDVRQMHGFAIKVGRRQGDFDTISRLIRTPDFAAVVRSFDVAEIGWQRRQTDIRAFVVRTVDNLPDKFNTWKKGEKMWTVYGKQGVGRHSLQSYLTTRMNTGLVSETGRLGSGEVRAWEVLAAGPTPVPWLEYQIEHILERGHVSTDALRASGLFGQLTATVTKGHEIELRYVRTSGDDERGDGVRGGFDTFYMANGPLGGLGIMRATNLHATSIGGTHRFTPKLAFAWRVHDARMTNPNDGWYSSRFILRPGAASSRIGTETDFIATRNVSPRFSARLGFFRLFPSGYLTDTGSHGSPYEVRLQMYGTF